MAKEIAMADGSGLDGIELLLRRGDLDGAEAALRHRLTLSPPPADAWRRLGVLLTEQGREQEAADALRQALALTTTEAGPFALDLARVLGTLSQSAEAEAMFRQAAAESPAAIAVEAWFELARMMRNQGRPEKALTAVCTALDLDRDHPEALLLLAQLLIEGNRRETAIALCRRVLVFTPAEAEVHLLLGNLLRRQGLPAEAAGCYHRAVTLAPMMAEAGYNLGVTLQDLGQPQAAEAAWRTVLTGHPGHLDSLRALAGLLWCTGQTEPALALYRQTLEIWPAAAEVHYNLGVALHSLGRLAEAASAFEAAARFRPDLRDAHHNLSVVLRDLGRLGPAEDAARRALALAPNHPDYLFSLGNVLKTQGRAEEAVALFRRARTLAPAHGDLARTLLSTLLYLPEPDPDRLFAEHRAIAAAFEATGKRGQDDSKVAAQCRFDDGRAFDPDRRLRVGWLSSDLYGHPVGRNLMPVFEGWNRERFDVFCYADVERPDAMTERFRQLSDGWRDLRGLDDEAVAAQIRADRIDVLLCLAGRFDRNRPWVCVRRPAPVQISFHDPATSGLEAFDYLLADPILVPRATPERFTERVFRLHTFYAADPIAGAPDPGPPPALTRGHVTFASANALAKISPRQIALWARVLKAVPDSRLRLKHMAAFGDTRIRQRFLELFADQGIAADRLNLVAGGEETRSHLCFYLDADITLDTFPFTGSTTSFESLWMGVPVVTLAGPVMVSRWSAAMVTRLDRPGWMAGDEDGYVAIAATLARDPAALAAERASLRARLAASPLCNRRRVAQALERACRAMWRRWCRTRALNGNGVG